MTGSELPELPLSAKRRAGSLPQEEVERLLRLMGGMLADAYADACTIIAERPRHLTASHLVSHLAREIDSGLRELLTAVLPAERQDRLAKIPKDREDSYDPPRREVIAEICSFLRIPADTDVARTWTQLDWAGRAHRDALRVPRAFDESLLKLWDDFAHVLLMVGRGFEASYLAAVPMIDALAAIETPTKQDLERLRNKIPQSRVALERFFAAAGQGWFYQLRRARYFETAEPLRPDHDGLVAYVPWPPGPYLVRVAAEPTHAADVVAIFEALQTDNPQASESAADVALVVPAALAARLTPKLAQFLQSFAQWALPSKATEVAVRLAAESQRDAALVIVKALVPVPDPGGVRSWFFSLEDIAPAFAGLGIELVRLLADRLCAAGDDPDNRFDLAYSRIWRPQIARDRAGRDDRDKFVTALRDAAAAVADSVGVTAVVEVLDGYDPAIFSRISLHLLSQYPDSDLVERRLTSPKIFADPEVDREYGVLLRQEYANLAEPAQEAISALIDLGSDHDASEDYIERWRFRQLARLGGHLPDRYRAGFEVLVAKYGPPADEDADNIEFAMWSGPQSPVTTDEIASMTDTGLLTLLATWRETGEWRAPTIDGLRVQLEAAIAADAARFSRLSPHFIDLNPTYATALLTVLTRLASDKQPPSGSATSAAIPQKLAWPELLDFTQAVIDTSHSGNGEPSENHSYGASWRGCRLHVAELLAASMRNHVIELDYASRVLAQLVQLTEDPGPRGDRVVLDDYDAIAEALNAVPSMALAAVIEFIRWISLDQHVRLTPEYDKAAEVLDAHLDPSDGEGSAVRSIYGMYLGVLLLYRPDWTRANRDRIFDSRGGAGLRQEAWQSFLRTNRPSQSTYALLGREYETAVRAFPTETAEDDTPRAQNEAVDCLLGHIVVLYGWGLIPLDGPLMTTLMSSNKAISLRARLMEIGGQMLARAVEPAPDLVARMQALWEWREAELAAGATAPQELSSVGWWASSPLISPEWALLRIRRLLVAGGAPEPAHLVTKRLAELVTTHLADTVDCVSLLIDAPTDRWFLDRSHKEITTVLTAGVHGSDQPTRQRAVDTVNRLVARGRTTFAGIVG